MEILSFEKTKKLLLSYKIPLCETEIVKSPAEAAEAAKRIGYPVALKVFSGNVLHRTDLGLVKINIQNESELAYSYEKIVKKAKKVKVKSEGILVQEMATGVETAIGVKRDVQFGPVIMFGLGGILVEVLKDVSFRICPVSEKEAVDMINETKGAVLFSNFRGRKAVKTEDLAKIIANLSELAQNEEQIQEIDLNPVIVNEKSATIVDFKFLI